MSETWEDTIAKYRLQLELIGDWAATVGNGTVRDCCRRAEWELAEVLDRHRRPIDGRVRTEERKL